MREQSLVARSARERQGVIVNDVQADPGFLPNKLLPDTHSEMAVPLMVGDQILGVLDVQSDQIGSFHPGRYQYHDGSSLPGGGGIAECPPV